jgi:hypothetical protein
MVKNSLKEKVHSRTDENTFFCGEDTETVK